MDGAPNTPQGEQMNENNAGNKIEIIDNEWKNNTLKWWRLDEACRIKRKHNKWTERCE